MTNWSQNGLSSLGIKEKSEKKPFPPSPELIRPSPRDATPLEELVPGPNVLLDRRLNLDLENELDNAIEETEEEKRAREKTLEIKREKLKRLAALPEEDFGMEWDVIYEADQLPLFKEEEEEVVYEQDALEIDEAAGAKYRMVADIEYVEAYPEQGETYPGQVFPQTGLTRAGEEEDHYQTKFDESGAQLHQNWDPKSEDQWAVANSEETDFQNQPNNAEEQKIKEAQTTDEEYSTDEEVYLYPGQPTISSEVFENPVQGKHDYVDSAYVEGSQDVMKDDGQEKYYPQYDDIVTYPSADMMIEAPYQGNLLGADSMQVVCNIILSIIIKIIITNTTP